MKKINNKGLSLVELVIAVGIFALVMVVILRMMTISTKTYNSGNNEINAQNEAQTLMNQLDNILADASEVTKDGTVYTIKRGTSESASTVVVHYLPDSLFYYASGDVAEEESPSDNYLMAEGVTAFNMDLSNVESYRYVSVDLTVTRSGASFTATKNIFLRNVGSVSSSGNGGAGGEGGNSSGGSGAASVQAVTLKKIRVYPNPLTITKGESISDYITVYKVYSDGKREVCTSWTADQLKPTESKRIKLTYVEEDKEYNVTLIVNVIAPPAVSATIVSAGPGVYGITTSDSSEETFVEISSDGSNKTTISITKNGSGYVLDWSEAKNWIIANLGIPGVNVWGGTPTTFVLNTEQKNYLTNTYGFKFL